MKWFKDEELRCKCCGALPTPQKENEEALVREVLDPLREAYGKPIVVNSAYRCPKHNKEVGGVNGSQHLRGEAADIHCADNKQLAKLIVLNGKFDQLILYPTFLHVSWKKNGPNRRQILRKVGTRYQPVSSKELYESQGAVNHRGQEPGFIKDGISVPVPMIHASPHDSVPVIHGKEVAV